MPCGHAKILACYVDESEYVCDVIVDDVSPVCQHPIKRKCGETAAKTRCDKPCGARLDCGHVCPKKCHIDIDPEHSEVCVFSVSNPSPLELILLNFCSPV